jgi:hypothetical protein
MIKDLQSGQYIYIYVDTVISEHKPEVEISYYRVIKLTPKTVVLRWEHEDLDFRKKREWVESNFYPVGNDWHPEIPIG